MRVSTKHVDLSFVVLSKAWYGSAVLQGRTDGVVDDIIVEVLDKEQNLLGEFIVEWCRTTPRKQATPSLRVSCDSWLALAYCQKVIDWMVAVHRTDPSVSKMAALLKQMGFRDATPRKRGES